MNQAARGPVQVRAILDDPNRRLVCPNFQRRFKWKTSQFTDLWNDIDLLLTDGSEVLFLGAFILKAEGGHALDLNTSLVVDGQQRLTTLALIIAAAASIARDHNLVDPNHVVTSTDEDESEGRLSDTIGSYLFVKGRSSANSTPKFEPTTFDKPEYNRILKALEVKDAIVADTGSNYKSPLLKRAFDENKRQLSERMEEHGSSDRAGYLLRIVDILLSKLHVIYVDLDDQYQINEVFDRLNRTGAKLNIVDLARNEVFRRFSAANDSDKATYSYENVWKPFEASVGTDYIDDLFFPYALIKNPTTTQQKAFSSLSAYWARQLASKRGVDEDAQAFVALVVEDLNYYKAAFVAITQGVRPEDCADSIWEVLRSLYLMPAPKAVYPFAIRLVSEYLHKQRSESFTHDSLLLMESFLIRRAFSGLEPTGLHAVFKAAYQRAIGDTGKEDISLVSDSFTSGTISFPSDKQFKEDIRKSPFYGRKVSRFVLLEYERSLRSHSGVSDTLYSDKQVTIDHIMPQTLKNTWLKTASSYHAEFIDIWANLILLSAPLNSLKSTKSFAEASRLISRENNFVQTKDVLSTYKSWRRKEMLERTELLTKFAVNRWPKDTLLTNQ